MMAAKTVLPKPRGFLQRLVDKILKPIPAHPATRPPDPSPPRQLPRHREKLFPMF